MTNPDSDEFHQGTADHPNDGEATQGNDPERVATELNEESMAEAEKEVCLVVSTSVSCVQNSSQQLS